MRVQHHYSKGFPENNWTKFLLSMYGSQEKVLEQVARFLFSDSDRKELLFDESDLKHAANIVLRAEDSFNGNEDDAKNFFKSFYIFIKEDRQGSFSRIAEARQRSQTLDLENINLKDWQIRNEIEFLERKGEINNNPGWLAILDEKFTDKDKKNNTKTSEIEKFLRENHPDYLKSERKLKFAVESIYGFITDEARLQEKAEEIFEGFAVKHGLRSKLVELFPKFVSNKEEALNLVKSDLKDIRPSGDNRWIINFDLLNSTRQNSQDFRARVITDFIYQQENKEDIIANSDLRQATVKAALGDSNESTLKLSFFDFLINEYPSYKWPAVARAMPEELGTSGEVARRFPARQAAYLAGITRNISENKNWLNYLDSFLGIAEQDAKKLARSEIYAEFIREQKDHEETDLRPKNAETIFNNPARVFNILNGSKLTREKGERTALLEAYQQEIFIDFVEFIDRKYQDQSKALDKAQLAQLFPDYFPDESFRQKVVEAIEAQEPNYFLDALASRNGDLENFRTKLTNTLVANKSKLRSDTAVARFTLNSDLTEADRDDFTKIFDLVSTGDKDFELAQAAKQTQAGAIDLCRYTDPENLDQVAELLKTIEPNIFVNLKDAPEAKTRVIQKIANKIKTEPDEVSDEQIKTELEFDLAVGNINELAKLIDKYGAEIDINPNWKSELENAISKANPTRADLATDPSRKKEYRNNLIADFIIAKGYDKKYMNNELELKGLISVLNGDILESTSNEFKKMFDEFFDFLRTEKGLTGLRKLKLMEIYPWREESPNSIKETIAAENFSLKMDQEGNLLALEQGDISLIEFKENENPHEVLRTITTALGIDNMDRLTGAIANPAQPADYSTKLRDLIQEEIRKQGLSINLSDIRSKAFEEMAEDTVTSVNLQRYLTYIFDQTNTKIDGYNYNFISNKITGFPVKIFITPLGEIDKIIIGRDLGS